MVPNLVSHNLSVRLITQKIQEWTLRVRKLSHFTHEKGTNQIHMTLNVVL